jgi:hypothetical protein
MDATDFQKLVLSEFPALREDFEIWEDWLHLQSGISADLHKPQSRCGHSK